MINAPIPLGHSEDQHLEFKSAREIEMLGKNKSDLGRSVVAMLNAEGGEIWIGLEEHESRAVKIEPIPRVEATRDAVWNHIQSTIDPPPRERDVQIVVVGAEDDQIQILCIRITKGADRPYAFTRQGRRYYLRSDRRIRDLTRDELRKVFGGPADERAKGDARAKRSLRKSFEELARNEKRALSWTGVQLVGAQLDLDQVVSTRLFDDPSLTGNLHGVIAGARLTVESASGMCFVEASGWGRLAVSRTGRIEQHVPIDRLVLRSLEQLSRSGRTMHPLAWIANTTFAVRLAAAVLSRASDATVPRVEHVLVDAGIANAPGLEFRPFSPDSIGFELEHPGHPFRRLAQDSVAIDEPLLLEADELRGHPDRCALRLIERLYEAVGLSVDEIPHHFDRAAGKLLI